MQFGFKLTNSNTRCCYQMLAEVPAPLPTTITTPGRHQESAGHWSSWLFKDSCSSRYYSHSSRTFYADSCNSLQLESRPYLWSLQWMLTVQLMLVALKLIPTQCKFCLSKVGYRPPSLWGWADCSNKHYSISVVWPFPCFYGLFEWLKLKNNYNFISFIIKLRWQANLAAKLDAKGRLKDG